MAKPIKGRGGKVSAAAWLGKVKGTVSEQQARAKADIEQRTAAARDPKSIILNPKDVQGEYDASRMLYTTLGGEVRAITSDDLAAFRHNIRLLQSRYKGGIKARQVLDLSLKEDREKANGEIRHAVAVSSLREKVRFVTNAGPNSDVTRHHVTVAFLSYFAAAIGANDEPKKSAQWLRKQPLAFDCDCGRHRYWFRYIASIGGFNAGRPESGFPKIRNPNLHGVACKHVLRVMAEIESGPGVLGFLVKMIEKTRASETGKANVSQTQAEVAEGVSRQRGRDIDTAKRRQDRAREAAKTRRALAKAAESATPPKRVSSASRRIDRAIKTGAINDLLVANMRAIPGMTEAMISAAADAAMKAMRKG